MKASTYSALGFVVTAFGLAVCMVTLGGGVPHGAGILRLGWAFVVCAMLWTCIGVEFAQLTESHAQRPARDALAPLVMMAAGLYASISLIALVVARFLPWLRPSWEIGFHAVLFFLFARPMVTVLGSLVVSRDDELTSSGPVPTRTLSAKLKAEAERLAIAARTPGTNATAHEIATTMSRMAETLRYSMPADERLRQNGNYAQFVVETERILAEAQRIGIDGENAECPSDLLPRLQIASDRLTALRAREGAAL
jgi:hypothetical protein